MSIMRYKERTKRVVLVAGTALLFAALTFIVMRDNGLPFLDGVNLIFHEAGHVIFFFMPQLVIAFAGTFMQLAVPIACAVHFLSRRAHVATLAALWWVGENLIGVSMYIGDARTQALPLLGNSEHDWHYVLNTFGILTYDTVIGTFVGLIGFLLMAGSVAGLTWFAYRVSRYAA